VDDLFKNPISAATRFCAVYGQPIRHSGSPAMHNPALAKLGLDWRYLAFEVSPDALGQAIEGARAMHFVGLNLTVPHKLLALELVDALDESATTWGAVNTICFEAKNDSGDWTPLGQLADSRQGLQHRRQRHHAGIAARPWLELSRAAGVVARRGRRGPGGRAQAGR
jgi:shikimate 5-dehydrogenase